MKSNFALWHNLLSSSTCFYIHNREFMIQIILYIAVLIHELNIFEVYCMNKSIGLSNLLIMQKTKVFFKIELNAAIFQSSIEMISDKGCDSCRHAKSSVRQEVTFFLSCAFERSRIYFLDLDILAELKGPYLNQWLKTNEGFRSEDLGTHSINFDNLTEKDQC